ncbi:protein FAM171A2 isoform X2 [Trichomycterus rosablanca]|uniref:protein FAM171A2 isoform X2 n=1 Tax=Trichomycterus rosablanca TaxID=2290929 RepID=UPI002F35A339
MPAPRWICAYLTAVLVLVVFAVGLKCEAQRAAVEVLIKVQVFDNSDLSPLREAAVQVSGNQSTLASGKAGDDGIVTVTFLYQPGTWVIVAASKRGFVTNSAPWHANRIPCSSSQPWVQLQRKAIGPSSNISYNTLSAMLTSTRSQYELGGFPYPLGIENNTAGSNSSWLELTALAAVCATLTEPNGTELQLSGPVHVSVPLPSDVPLKSATSVPIWRFDDRAGLWVKSGVGHIRKEGSHLTWSFVAPHLGYWLAAFPLATGTLLNLSGLRDITTYHTIFLLTILGFLALLVLILLCLLLYYCRRRCLKPRHRHRKMHVYSTLESSKKDQGTSTSHLNLISSGHLEIASSARDLDGVKLDSSTSRDQGRPKQRHSKRKYVENIPLQTTRSTNTNDQDLIVEDSNKHNRHYHNAKGTQGYNPDPSCQSQLHYQEQRRDSKPPEYTASQAADHLTRPVSMNGQPGQLIFCHSMEQMKDSMYHSVVPTLVIPAHYMRLSSDLSAMEQAVDRQQQLQHDMEGIQVSMTLSRQQNQQQQQESEEDEEDKADQHKEGTQEQNWSSESSSGPVHIPVLFNESTMTQMNSELKALTDKKLLELGVKPHPLAWFVSLDGRSNSLVRHSYIELGSEPFRVPAQEHHAETYPGNSNKSQRRCKDESKAKKGAYDKIYSKPPVIDTSKPSSSTESQTVPHPPEEGSTGPLLESRDGTFPRKGRSRDHSACSSITEVHRDSVTSRDDEDEDEDDKDDDGENKKSPWQKREERPLMVFK